MPELVSCRVSGGIATVEMDDGRVNVLSPSMLSSLDSALDEVAAAGAVAVITGREGVFSAGFDLKVLTAGGHQARSMLRQGFDLALRLLSFPAPVVLACNGHALAMASFLLLSADYRIGADGPFKIGANEVAIGFPVPRAAIEICRQRLAPAHFSRAVVTAEIYPPARAVVAGFLDEVVPPSELAEAAAAAAARLAELDLAAHARTKLAARGPALEALRAAIDADEDDMGRGPRAGSY